MYAGKREVGALHVVLVVIGGICGGQRRWRLLTVVWAVLAELVNDRMSA